MKVLIPSNAKIGVGVSGGVDSMVLLYSLLEQGADITVINIEHGIRGDASKKDSEFVKAFCDKNGIAVLQFSFDTLAESKKNGESVELCARNLRYKIFDKLLADKTVDYIALAHHASDNAETILMRIIRGTGIRGLRGISDREGYIHPLISYSRMQIEEFAKEKAIPYVVDSTNFEVDYTRNYLRNVIFSELRKKFSNVDEGFARLAENAVEVDDFLQTMLIPYEKNGEVYSLLVDKLENSHNVIKKYSVAKLLSDMGAKQDIEARHLDYILELSGKENNTSIDLPFGITAAKEYDNLIFYYHEETEYYERLFDKNSSYIYGGYRYSFEKAKNIIKGGTFDVNKIPKGAVIRNRKDGDVFKKCNGRTKKLNDYLTDIKLPKRERNVLTVIASGNEILAVMGIEISDKIKTDENSNEILYIKKEQI